MAGQNFRALESLLPACFFVAGILTFGWGLFDSDAAQAGRAVVFLLAFPFVAIVPLFGPRAFRLSLLGAGVALLISFTVLTGDPGLGWIRNTAIGVGPLIAGASLTPRTQWIVSILRWLLAVALLAFCVAGIFASDGFASGGVILLLPITIPLFLALLHRSKVCFFAPRDEWYQAA